MENILIIHFAIQLIFAVCYLLWQFEVFGLSEETMTRIIIGLDIFETIILVITRFYKPTSGISIFMLGGFYIIEIVLLLLQLIFADLGVSIKIKSITWIIFYVFLFSNDVCGVNLIAIMLNSDKFLSLDELLKNTWFGELLAAIILSAFKSLFVFWLKKEND